MMEPCSARDHRALPFRRRGAGGAGSAIFFTGLLSYMLRTIPGDRILSVQVDDALPEPVGTMRDDTLNRLMPGDGSLDLHGAIAALDAIGGLSWVGPEVISPATASMVPVDAARQGRERIERIIAEVHHS